MESVTLPTAHPLPTLPPFHGHHRRNPPTLLLRPSLLLVLGHQVVGAVGDRPGVVLDVEGRRGGRAASARARAREARRVADGRGGGEALGQILGGALRWRWGPRYRTTISLNHARNSWQRWRGNSNGT